MTRRQLLAAATAAAVLAGVVIVSLFTVMSSGVSPKAVSGKTSQSIVVIGTAGLSWSDVSPRTTPALWSMLRDAATGTLAVHAVHANTCPVDGWLTLSAGEQAADSGSRRAKGGAGTSDGAKPPCNAIPAGMKAGKVPHWDEYVTAAKAARFDASLGLLGDQVATHGSCIQAVGPGAALGAARADGTVNLYEPYNQATLSSALAACPVTLIDVGTVRDPADVDQDEVRPTTTRAQQVAAIESRVARVLTSAPSGTDALLASLADAGVTERLRLVAITGPNFGVGTLESSSTKMPGLVQLSDLTPTILQHLNIPRPSSLGGTPLRFIPANESSDQSADARLRALLDYDEASHKVHTLVEPFFYAWVGIQLALYLGAAVLWKRGWGTRGQRRQLLRVTRRVAIVAATVPASTFLANLVPWWRSSAPLVGVVASVAVFATAISALALLGPWRRKNLGPVVVVCAATMAVLAVDVMTGSRLQLSSLMGLQPVIGGRFYGMGNVTFALFATATLMLCTAVGNHLLTGRNTGRSRFAAAVVGAIGLSAIVVDTAPWWGSDFGGPTALLPAVIYLVLVTLQIRLTPRRILFVGGGIGVTILLVGVLDWLRPAESRSHLGKFVQTTLDGGAWDIVIRKLEQNITLLFGPPLLLLVPPGLALFAYLLARPGSRLGAPLRAAFADIQLLRPGLIAIVMMWVISFALNDSGASIPAVGGTLALPLVIAIALRTLQDPETKPAPAPATSRASRRRQQ
ncbi:MAG: hypothetical protein QOE58_2342 [Actinomycetota bacterium]|nr:hypothetical protein [Actinomycetota bacterium]